MSDRSLLSFQLGPVQKFIEQAATVGDLRAGSELLSELTAAAINSLPSDSELVFPSKEGNPDLKGIPNRFLAFVPRDSAGPAGGAAAKAAQNKLVEISRTVKAQLGLEGEEGAAFDKQVSAFLQTSWAVLKEPSGRMGEDYATLGKLMACRRNTRAFDPWEEVGNKPKDFLSGRENALRNGRGAMNLIKACRAGNPPGIQGDENEKYRAVLAMDGDSMGKRLSGFTTEGDHRAFSQSLAAFAAAVKDDIPEGGELIYVGGDDVLAVVNATDAIEVAEKVRRCFGEKVVGCTTSAGIAIGHVSVPLQELIRAGHAAESRAKQAYGRDALAVTVFKRSGEILEWGSKWDNSAAFEIYKVLSKTTDVARFAYKLAEFLEPYDLKPGDLENPGMRDVVFAETKHAIERTEAMKGFLPEKSVNDYLNSVTARPQDYLNLFLVETFIDRPRD